MRKSDDYYIGFIVGFGISTIAWCIAWSLLVGKISDIHKKEIDYLIEKKA